MIVYYNCYERGSTTWLESKIINIPLKKHLRSVFTECLIINEYIWTDKEVHQLLDDIDENNGSDKEYFVGTVLVSPTEIKNHYEVIDGQQRLTTFYLILCALRHQFEGEKQSQTISGLISTDYTTTEGEIVSTLKLDPRYENASELMNKIVECNDDPAKTRMAIQLSGINSFGSLENILNAYDAVYRYLEDNYKANGSLKKYWGYLSNNVVFIQISTDVSSALKIFETINERGIGLNPMDLLKNLLFTQVKKDDFNKLKNQWKKVTGPLEKHKEKALRFLRYYLMANIKYIIKEATISLGKINLRLVDR